MSSIPDPTAFVRDAMPLCATLGVRARGLGGDRVVLELDWRPALCTAGGILHGGVLMALADSAAATFAFLHLPEGATGTTTVDAHTHLLGAVREGTVTATARGLHVGRSTVVVEVEVADGEGRPVAKTSQTQLVLR